MNNNTLRLLLGFKGGAVEEELPQWSYHLQLLKPGTWLPLIIGIFLGVISSGSFTWTVSGLLTLTGLILITGPLMTGFSQTINDLFDREVDALNEPYRPIPSGRISVDAAMAQAIILLGGAFFLALLIDAFHGSSVGRLMGSGG